MKCENCGVIDSATEKIKTEKRKNSTKKLLIICATVLLCVLFISSAVCVCYSVYKQQETIIEQQYALNMQYASLMEYVANAEITYTDEASADGDGSIAVAGDGNTTAGGDIVNGE